MRTVGAYEAKTRFGELLREVENGETIIVTRHGFPVARLSPMAKEADDVAAAMEEIHRFRREHRPTLGESLYASSSKRDVSRMGGILRWRFR
jgi:prevent-host-death family protein